MANFLPKLKSQLNVQVFDPNDQNSQVVLTVLSELKSWNMDFKPIIDSFLSELKKSGKIDANFNISIA